jgi:hypothetical protein
MALGVNDHQNGVRGQCTDADVAYLAVVLPVIDPCQYGALKDVFGVIEADTVFFQVGFALCRVLVENHLLC